MDWSMFLPILFAILTGYAAGWWSGPAGQAWKIRRQKRKLYRQSENVPPADAKRRHTTVQSRGKAPVVIRKVRIRKHSSYRVPENR